MPKVIHFKERKIEWWFASQTAGLGLFLMHPESSMDSIAFETLTRWMPEYDWGLLFMVTGAAHLTALGINGRRWWTPFVRVTATVVNALTYAAFMVGFSAIDPWTTAVWTYGPSILSAACICIFGAAEDTVAALKNRKHAG